MIEITAEIRALIDKAAAGVELAGDEYIDPADGLIHCKKCGGQRQTVVPCFGKSGYFMPRCICQCQREAEEQRKAAEERQRRIDCTLEITEGTAKVFWISGSDEAVTLIEATGTYSDTITLPDGGNYIGIECENFTGNIELNIE